MSPSSPHLVPGVASRFLTCTSPSCAVSSSRLRIQNSLSCCGFYNALRASSPVRCLLAPSDVVLTSPPLSLLPRLARSDEATPSATCYPRSPLHGCKGKLYRFSKMALAQFATAAFSVVPIHLANIFVSLICSNHVNKSVPITTKSLERPSANLSSRSIRLFGKGITPKQYRLRCVSLSAIQPLTPCNTGR